MRLSFSLLAFLIASSPVLADTLIKARYEITVAGFRIGIAGLEGQFSDQAYAAGVSVKLSGLAKMMAAGEGSVEAEGKINNGKALPSNYKLHLNAGEKKENVAFDFNGASVTSLSALPQRQDPQGTIPLKSNHKANVLDPLSAGVFTSSEMASNFNQDACNKTFPIFDGRQRYDMSFSFARKEPLKAIGYRGDALVCKARYTPVAGHVAGRADVVWLTNNRNMEVWLVPIHGTKSFIPARMKIETQVGTAIIDPVRLDLGGSTASKE